MFKTSLRKLLGRVKGHLDNDFGVGDAVASINEASNIEQPTTSSQQFAEGGRVQLAKGTKDSLLDSKLEAEEELREIARKNEVYAESRLLPDMYSVSDERFDAAEQFRRENPSLSFRPPVWLFKIVQRLVQEKMEKCFQKEK